MGLRKNRFKVGSCLRSPDFSYWAGDRVTTPRNPERFKVPVEEFAMESARILTHRKWQNPIPLRTTRAASCPLADLG